MKRRLFSIPDIVLVFISILFFVLSWFPLSWFPCIFIAVVPLLVLAEKNPDSSFLRNFLMTASALMLWNVYAYTVLYYNTLSNFIISVTGNTILMSIPFAGFLILRKYTGLRLLYSVLLFVLLWPGMEYLWLHWELTQPWLLLGNALADMPVLIYWYACTGVLGGSLWIVLLNGVVFLMLMNTFYKAYHKLLIVALLILVPAGISLTIDKNVADQHKLAGKIAVINPGFHPLKEKSKQSKSFIPYQKQLDSLISCSKSVLDQKTRLLFWPENAMPAKSYDEMMLVGQDDIKYIYDALLQDHPDLSLITGITTYKVYYSAFDASPTATFVEGGAYYDYYNAAIHLRAGKKVGVYHKKQLNPWLEKTPWHPVLDPVLNFMGCSVPDLGRQKTFKEFKVSPELYTSVIINNEILYPGYLKQQSKQGIHVTGHLVDNTQWGMIDISDHLRNLAVIRSIETNTVIAQAFINKRGSIVTADGAITRR